MKDKKGKNYEAGQGFEPARLVTIKKELTGVRRERANQLRHTGTLCQWVDILD